MPYFSGSLTLILTWGKPWDSNTTITYSRLSFPLSIAHSDANQKPILSYFTLLPAVVRCRGMVPWEARSSVARLWIKPNDGVAEAFYTGLWARRFNPVLGCNRDNQMIALVWPTLFQAIYPWNLQRFSGAVIVGLYGYKLTRWNRILQHLIRLCNP